MLLYPMLAVKSNSYHVKRDWLRKDASRVVVFQLFHYSPENVDERFNAKFYRRLSQVHLRTEVVKGGEF